jgi:hypothetical protein
MIEITLTQNQTTVVSDIDAYLACYRWHAHWSTHTRSYYAVRNDILNGKKVKIQMARQILGLEYGDRRQADHINHTTLDNTRPNLRIVTNQENQFNQKHAKGYCWNKQHKKYMAYIKVGAVRKNLGYFDSKKEARNAYLKAKKDHHQI